MTSEQHPPQGAPAASGATPERASLASEVSRLEAEIGPHAHHPLVHFPMFEQLRQRNVVRVAVLYLVVCWLILDPVHVVFHMLDVPIWADRLVVILMALGLPAAVIFAWVYEVTPEGLKPAVDAPDRQSIRQLTGRRLDRAIIAVMAVALAYFAIDKFWISQRSAGSQPAPAVGSERSTPAVAAPTTATASSATVASFNPPAHSIAVLPFLNMSGDAAQEYFSDGLTEELLNSLARINELQVAARTSSFSFKGKDADISAVAPLEWLGTAVSLRDPGLVVLKTDRLLDPLRHEARFQAIETALRFP